MLLFRYWVRGKKKVASILTLFILVTIFKHSVQKQNNDLPLRELYVNSSDFSDEREQ